MLEHKAVLINLNGNNRLTLTAVSANPGNLSDK